MPGLYLHNAEEVRAACLAGQDAIARAVAGAFDATCELTIGSVVPLAARELPAAWRGPGLVFVFRAGHAGALALLPEAGGAVPEWCRQPDGVGQAKLRTLALELGAIFFPAEVVSLDSAVVRVPDLSEAVRRAELAAEATCVPIELKTDGKVETLSVVWPSSQPSAVLTGVVPSPADRSQSPVQPAAHAPVGRVPSNVPPPSTDGAESPDFEEGLRRLPAYARSLLKIRVPVTVTLAESRQPLRSILGLGPGSILQFNKPCDATLTLEVAGHKFAEGETVKVGDSFGLWITSMMLPEERFWVISGRQPAKRVR